MPVALITKAERITTGSKHGYSPEESCAFYKKWINLRSAAKTRRVRCTLTFEQYVRKAKRAGITPNQIGLASGQYQMARWTDSGNYANNSCRFVTAQENIDDKFLNGGIASHAEKIRGRTKRVDPGLAVLSDKLARHFVAVSPQGKRYRGKNAKEFCKRHCLDPGHMFSVLRGERRHHKGWTGRYA